MLKKQKLRKAAITVAVPVAIIVAVMASSAKQKAAAQEAYREKMESMAHQQAIDSLEELNRQAAKNTELLARIAMSEAEGQDVEGKALVILTVLNRSNDSRFPDSVEGVIYQKGQFASVSSGKFLRVEPDSGCYAALRLVDGGWDESQGALYFNKTPGPGETTWHSRNLAALFTHGNRTFYTERGESE